MTPDPRPARSSATANLLRLLSIALPFFALVASGTVRSSKAGPICAEVVGQLSKEVASADFNADGFADFAVTVEPNSVAIVLGQAGAQPTRLLQSIPTGAAVDGIAAGDMNGDGHADLVIAQPTWNVVRVLLGHGDGTFAYGDPVDAGPSPYRPVLGDLDGDGDLDVALLSGLGSTATDELSILLNQGGGVLGARIAFDLTPYPSAQDDIACGDIDGDGDDDVAVLRRGIVSGLIAKTIVLARSNGDGTFSLSAPITEDVSSSAIALGDVDHDGRADLVTRDGDIGIGGTPPRRLSTYFGRSDGTFGVPARAPMTNIALAGRLRLADMNEDGNLDAIMTAGPVFGGFACQPSAVGVAVGDGAGGFIETPAVPAGGIFATALAIGDADGDGHLDVATTSNVCGTLVLSPGNGDGTLRVLSYTSSLARAFTDKNKDVIRLNSNKSSWCFGFESLDGSFDVATDVVGVTLISPGTGSVDQISSDASKPLVVGDADHNGFPDITVCFAKEQLRQLFGNLTGRTTVSLIVLGELAGIPCPAQATLTVDVVPGGNGNGAAMLRRDASGDAWTLFYRADRGGPMRVRLFDVNGRLVRTIESSPASAGWNEVRFDGRDDAGRRLPSGVLFYRMEQGPDRSTGKIVIAR